MKSFWIRHRVKSFYLNIPDDLLYFYNRHGKNTYIYVHKIIVDFDAKYRKSWKLPLSLQIQSAIRSKMLEIRPHFKYSWKKRVSHLNIKFYNIFSLLKGLKTNKNRFPKKPISILSRNLLLKACPCFVFMS